MRLLLCLMLCLAPLIGSSRAVSIVDYWPDEPEHTEEILMSPAAFFAGEEGEVYSDVSLYASVSPSYGVGTTNITLFKGVAAKLGFGEHYVYWRESQYVYAFAYGEGLSYDGSRFVGSGVTVVRYNTYTGSGGQAGWSAGMDNAFSLVPGSYLVWSDLGSYPVLYERRAADYAQTACVILCSIVLYYLFHHLWSDIRQRYI